jgi:hypothetical protein
LSYGQFELASPEEDSNIAISLHHQLGMIRWYLDRQHIVQAILLAREWLVSVIAFRFGLPIFDVKRGREPVEIALNNAALQAYEPEKVESGVYDFMLIKLPNKEDIVNLWQRLAQTRNDIAHCGMRLSAKRARSLVSDAENFYTGLERIKTTLLPPVSE